MYEVKDGPLPDGVTVRGEYGFERLKVGQWFFATGKKPSTVRAAAASFRTSHAPETKFSCVAAQVDGHNGTVCKRLA